MAIRSKHLIFFKCLEENTLLKQAMEFTHLFGVTWQLSAKARRDIFLGYSLQSTDFKGLVINQPKMSEGSKAQVNNDKL